MRFAVLVLSLLPAAWAFPRALLAEGLDVATPVLRRQVSVAETNCGAAGPCLTFDAADQYTSTTGAHAYQSPGASDVRGPCPGLNAAANHGYIQRNGIVDIPTAQSGLSQAYRMDETFAGFLAAWAVINTGNVTSGTFSIGGPNPGIGLSYSHDYYEGDASLTRNDAYLDHGDAHSLNVTQFTQLITKGLATNTYTLDIVRQLLEANQDSSVANNPYYYSPFFSTTAMSPGMYLLAINYFSNHSAAIPSGYLNSQILKEFFAVTGTYPNFQWLPGQERIPDNWYARPSSEAVYNFGSLVQDLLLTYSTYPSTFRFGGNTNGVNSYQQVDISQLTGGTYTNEGVSSQANDFACFLFRDEKQMKYKTMFPGAQYAQYKAIRKQYIHPVRDQYQCAKFCPYNSQQLNIYPGRNYHPTGPDQNF